MSRRQKHESQPAPVERRRRFDVRVAALAAVAAVLVVAAASVWFVVAQFSGPSGPPRAAIVDQLSLTFPNPDFNAEATAKLTGDGYEVDYFPGEEVTVDFFLDLPERGYDLILFRVHSAALGATIEEELLQWVSLFTGEPYDEAQFQAFERQSGSGGQFGALSRVRYVEDGDPYFGITPVFIADRMKGDFDGATVVLMGCESLSRTATADAFLEKGAKEVIGWDKTVSATHTDAATLSLLDYFLGEDMPARDAVAATMSDVGPDPVYDSTLVFYPPED
jgi:hypothetical protein